MAAAIHVTCRLDQKCVAKFCRCRVPFAWFLPSQPALVREKIDNHEPDVVASVRVLRARIAQACDQANAWSFLFHVRSIRNPQSAIRNQIYFFCSFSFGAGGPPLPAAGAPFAPAVGAPFAPGAGAVASPSSFFAVMTSGPAAAAASASGVTGSSSITGAITENAVKSG